MARQAYGITTSAITWEPTESEISVSETGMVEISVEGAVNSRGIGLLDALKLIPNTLPVGSNGPIGIATELTGAALSTKSAFYKEGTWQVRATYQKGGAITAELDGQDVSDNDRTERRIIVSEEPILTHPVAQAFPTQQLNLLANLIAGNIEPNMSETWTDELEEFVKADDTGAFTVPVTFSDTPVTVDGMEASPRDFARLIKAGVTSYQRKAIRHSWSTTRNRPAKTSEYNKVGTVFTNPPNAPSISDGRQWLLTGIIDTSSNDDAWNTHYEFDASGPGGWLKALYKGGSAELSMTV